MSKVTIEVDGLSKLYRLGMIGYSTLRDSIQERWHKAIGKPLVYPDWDKRKSEFASWQAGPRPNTMWAIHDVSFTVQEGEVLGLIGRNGSGKSTLLKILSRITAPSHGRAVIRGRSSSLLEVGAGFHHDMSGRENVYLNGAILGMSRKEIDRKMDEIIDFSEISQFIDTPVKRYSSGMLVRLAFSVAAHLEQRILMIDEVLAVGDDAFRNKVIGKTQGLAGKGKTIIFVSHNMEVMSKLCDRCLYLDRGKAVMHDETEKVIEYYLQSNPDLLDKHRKLLKQDLVVA